MRQPSYLVLSRNGIFYFRCPIAKSLHPTGKPSTLKVSLGTRDPRSALHLSRYLGYVAPILLRRGAAVGMQYHQMRDLLRKHFAALLANRRLKMAQDGPLDVLDLAALETSVDIATGAVEGQNSISLVTDDAELVGRFVDHYKLPLEPGTTKFDQFRHELGKAYRDYCSTVLTENKALGSYKFDEPKEPPGKPEAVGPSVPLKDAVEKFVAESLRSNLWRERTEALRRAQLAMLMRLVGEETNLASIQKSEARSVSDKLQRLPRNMNKSPAFRNKSLEELLAMEHSSGMNVSTLNDYLGTYATLFAWAERQGYAQGENPFTGLALPTKKSGNKVKRKAFTDDQLQLIERTLLTDLAGIPTKPSHKWASLILMYTGARAGEVCQLRGSDIQEREGVPCFIIDDDEGKRVKNETSKRIVPIHSRLLELGIADFVRNSGTDRIFPDYTYSANYGLTKNISTWFNVQLLPKLKMKAPGIVLHSLRHTMNTKLHHADVPAHLVKAITGHTDDSMSTGTYFAAGFKPRQLKEAIERFSFQSSS